MSYVSDVAWLQSSLPVKSGGLGVRHAVDTAIPCFIVSVYSVLALITALVPEGFLAAG